MLRDQKWAIPSCCGGGCLTIAASSQIAPGADNAGAIKPHAARILVRSTISVDLRKAYRKRSCLRRWHVFVSVFTRKSRVFENRIFVLVIGRKELIVIVGLTGIEGSDDRDADRSSKIVPTATI